MKRAMRPRLERSRHGLLASARGAVFLLGSGSLFAIGCSGGQVSSDGGTDSGNGCGGSPVVVSAGAGSTARCTGQVAASAFRFGLCSCKDFATSAALTVDSFDSSQPGAMTFGNGGSVGVNGNFSVSGTSKTAVGGSLLASGTVTVNALTSGIDVQSGDTLSGNQLISIGRNGLVGGDVKCVGAFTVGGTLTFPATRMMTAPNAGVFPVVRAPVSVPPPCDCAAANLFDIAGYVTASASKNDNATIGLESSRLTNFAGDQTLNFSCGRFYLDRITGVGKVTLNVSGRSALFVGGDVNLTDSFVVNLSGSGELDLFLNGGLSSSTALTFGNKSTPARVRLYVGGARSIALAAGSVLGGNIYAPNSTITSAGSLELFGALLVGSLTPSAQVLIHHDVAILKASQECGTPGSGGASASCSQCQDCGGQACKAGSCGACSQNSDCCAPLSCTSGSCTFVAG